MSGRFVAVIILIVAIIGAITIFGLSQIEKEHRNTLRETLSTVLQTTRQALHTWQSIHQNFAKTWATSKELKRLTKVLLSQAQTREALLASPAQSELRQLLDSVIHNSRYEGYFLIGPQNQNLGSTRDANIGDFNLLTGQPFILKKLWGGEPATSLPQPSVVSLADRQGVLRPGQPTMFSGAPVRDTQGKVIALLTFRHDPATDFTALLQRGRVGESGETYAFDRQGRMISESRFDYQLRRIGLLKENQNGILNISIRDPGGLVDGEKPAMDFHAQPFTRMAISALAGESGKDLIGYRDYRGVPVVGVWAWDEKLNMGITTEIDVEEAFRNLHFIRGLVLLMAGLAVLFVIGLGMYLNIAQQVKGSENRYRDLIENSIQGILIQRDLKILLVNRTFADIYGYDSTEEILALGSIIPLVDPEELDEIIKRMAKSGEKIESSQHLQMIGFRRNGEKILVESFNRWIIWMGQPAILTTLIDITEKSLLEREMRQYHKLEAVAVLAKGVAHEFNNRMQIIQNAVEIAMNKLKGDGAIFKHLEKVIEVTQGTKDLTGKLLVFSRQEAFKPGKLDLNSLIREHMANAPDFQEAGIEVELALAESSIPVLGDAKRIHEVFSHLLDNAYKAMPNGGRLEITTEAFNADETFCRSHLWAELGEYVITSIRDSGAGIDAHLVDHMFDPFFTNDDDGIATGMGLSTSFGIIQQHGGMIEADGALGKGTTLKFYLPTEFT